MKKNNLSSCIIIAVLLLLIFSALIPLKMQAQYNYTPMEKIPGFENAANDFPSYILSVYKFGIWTVGIAALFMIIWGGFMYLTSAGNTSRMDSAKTVIFNALFGLIIALAAWLILFVINPDLVKINLSLKPVATLQPSVPSIARQPVSSTATCSDLNSSLLSDFSAADNGVPVAVLAAFMKRECAPAMSNSSACSSNNGSGAGGPMQFTDSTWNDLGCTGSKFNRQDALKCAAKKISRDSGGDYSEAGIEKAAKAYCGQCVHSNCGNDDYCAGIYANYQKYASC